MRLREAIPKEWIKVVQANVTTECQTSGTEKVKDIIKCSKIIYSTVLGFHKYDSTYIRNWWEKLKEIIGIKCTS